METKSDSHIGVIGLGVMGANLALNFEDHGFMVSLWNRTTAKTERFTAEHAGKKFVGAKTLDEFVQSLERPRRILIMVEAGPAVDAVIESLKPLLQQGDILLDGGNSWFKDTERRGAALQAEGVHFFGVGVSGGERGARFGPSLMPGGPAEAYPQIEPLLQAIAAKTESGPCVTYCGPDGAGHFIKMVHNGIEYGDMQLIAEAYDVLRKAINMGASELADVFTEWDSGPLESFLIELTARVFLVQDEETGRPLIDLVSDRAAQKGTGKWAAQTALDLNVPIPTITAAIEARLLSAMKEERTAAGKKLRKPGEVYPGDKRELIASIHDALVASKISSYAQGLSLIRAASVASNWNVNLKEIARIWKGGCIIRARLLNSIMDAYTRDPDLVNLLVDREFMVHMDLTQPAWRSAVNAAQTLGIPVPAMSASLAYFDSYRSASLPQNLTQAQRDAFGAHTYERIDHPERGSIHTDWEQLAEERMKAMA